MADETSKDQLAHTKKLISQGRLLALLQTMDQDATWNFQVSSWKHKSIKSRRYRGLWLFTASFVLDKQLHLCCLLKYEGKKKYQSKVPSRNKLCFLFPLSPFSPVLYLLVFEFSIVIVNHVKGLGPFIDL